MVELGRVYVDSSVVIRLTLGQPGALLDIDFSSAFSSELTAAEVFRTIDRLRLSDPTPEEELAKLSGQSGTESKLRDPGPGGPGRVDLFRLCSRRSMPFISRPHCSGPTTPAKSSSLRMIAGLLPPPARAVSKSTRNWSDTIRNHP